MFGLGAQELLLILVIILVLFGAKRIPEMARGLGKSLTEFKKGVREVDSEIRDAADVDAADERSSDHRTSGGTASGGKTSDPKTP